MTEEQAFIIIDDDLVMDVNNGLVQSKNNLKGDNVLLFPTDEINSEIDKLNIAITDLETSLDPRTTSRLSEPRREGVYLKAGLLTNVVIGIIIALIVIILLV